MLSKRQNLVETIKGGEPDRYVKQYEFLELILEAPMRTRPQRGETIVDDWGVTLSWPKDQIGAFPVHSDGKLVISDISKWKEQLVVPAVVTEEKSWEEAAKHAEGIDRKEQYVTACYAPGTFERTHMLMGMEDAMMGLYEEPDCMHELINCLVDAEIEYARQAVKYIKPDALFHHDDWGSQISSFMSPDMFEEFFLEPYKRAYGFWKNNGVEVIVHHSDCYAANLVPYMIEMGIDIWQGVMTTNNTRELINKYGGQITFMGELDSGPLDHPEWSSEAIEAAVEEACTRCGKKYFIPCLSQGGPYSSFPGVYEAADKAIEGVSKKTF